MEPSNEYEDSSSSNSSIDGDDERVRVKFFTNESSLWLNFLKNQKYSLFIRSMNFIIKILPSLLYIIQVLLDNPSNTAGCCHICENHTLEYHDKGDVDITIVHWERLQFVNRRFDLWIAQVIAAILSIVQLCMFSIFINKGNKLCISFFVYVFLEIFSSLLFIITLFYKEKLRCLFVPSFLSCWLAKTQFEDISGDINRKTKKTMAGLFHRIIKLISSTFCLMFTSICGFQHLQRGGYRHFSLFESVWFTVITFTTVGYGDYKPDIWLSQAFMIVMIGIALLVIPINLERLVQAWMDKNKLGRTYSRYSAKREKHVVVCTTSLTEDKILDFLNEFYAHQNLQNYYVCLLSICDMSCDLKIIFHKPKWTKRVIYIQGSALKEKDLARCRMKNSEACFILAPTKYKDINSADQDTIICSWAIKDFAPSCPQFVQIYRPENKIHVRFAEHVLCLDEFKYTILGNNTLIPGISTLVTLLAHTSNGEEGQRSGSEWMKRYGLCSGNEVYHIKLNESKFFKDYKGQLFSHASDHAYRRYGVCLVAVSSSMTDDIQLNPGPQHTMKENDICFYLSITKEENSTISKIENYAESEPSSPRVLKRGYSRQMSRDQPDYSNKCGLIIGQPPAILYIGAGSCLCHLMSSKRQLCCIKLLRSCEHSSILWATDYQWQQKSVIVCASSPNYGLYNFIIPLRSQWISKAILKPIIILSEVEPDKYLQESISHFPLVYWMLGSIKNLDDLLKAGILLADKIVVIINEHDNKKKDTCEACEECDTIMTVHKIHLLFPHVTIITEISQRYNMRFALFSPEDTYSLSINKLEKKEKVRGSPISYIFRLPFAAGNVFSSNMLDTLLYQAFVKSYIITFFRLLLGIDQSPRSGHLSCNIMKEEDMSVHTYGELYKKMVKTTRNIPIGIYRTETREIKKDQRTNIGCNTKAKENRRRQDDKDILKMVQNRISTLDLPLNTHKKEDNYHTSYVIINPSFDLTLKIGDIIYLICPPLPMTTSTSVNDESHTDSTFSTNREYSTLSEDLSPIRQPLLRFDSMNSRQSSVENRNHEEDNVPLITIVKNSTQEEAA